MSGNNFIDKCRALLCRLEDESPKFEMPVGGRMIVTPELAADFLRRDLRSNRRITAGNIIQIVEDLFGDRWIYDAQPLRFDSDGFLIDGQHRLIACVLANRPIDTMIAVGLDPRAFEVIDTNKARDVANVLSIDGQRDTTYLSAAIRVAMAYEKRLIGWKGLRMQGTFSPRVVLAALKLNPGFENVMIGHHKRRNMPRSLEAYICWKTSRIDPVLGPVFSRQLFDGLDVQENTPVFHLRRKLEQMLPTPTRPAPKSSIVLGFAILTWNKTRDDPTWRRKIMKLESEGEFPSFSGDRGSSRFVLPEDAKASRRYLKMIENEEDEHLGK